jgi:hypothetical protein
VPEPSGAVFRRRCPLLADGRDHRSPGLPCQSECAPPARLEPFQGRIASARNDEPDEIVSDRLHLELRLRLPELPMTGLVAGGCQSVEVHLPALNVGS